MNAYHPPAYWALVEPHWLRLNEVWEDTDTFLRRFAETPPPSANLYAAHWCQSEVLNGGLHQFFFNTTGVLAPEAIAGLNAVGMHHAAQVLERATRIFGKPYPRSRTERLERLAWDGADPFADLSLELEECLETEVSGWEKAADAYAGSLAPNQSLERSRER